MIFVLIIFVVLSADLMIKKYMESKLAPGEEKPILHGRVILRKYHNKGFCLGIGKEQPRKVLWVSGAVILLVLINFIVELFRKGRHIKKIGMALLLGGAFCNWFDRLHQGYVTDYFSIKTKIRKIRKLVFNLSDFCILIGTLLCFFSEK